MTAVAAGIAARPPKHILVNGHKIHLRFLQNLIWVLIAIKLATAAVAGLYYLLFEVRYGPVFLKPGWDGLFPYAWWDVYRHGLRDVGEGVLANLAIRSLIVKWQKHPAERLTGSRLSVRAVTVLVLAFVLIIGGIALVNYVFPAAWHALHFERLTSPVHTTNGAVSGATAGFNWQDFVLGFLITHVIRVLWAPVGNTIQAAFIDRQVARAGARVPLWVRLPLAPPTLRERFSWVQETHPDVVPRKDIATRVVMAVTLLMIPLAAYGFYVLNVIAKG